MSFGTAPTAGPATRDAVEVIFSCACKMPALHFRTSSKLRGTASLRKALVDACMAANGSTTVRCLSSSHTLLLLLLLLRRWVVINKDPSKAGSLTLRIPKASGYATSASVSRLLASSSDPLSATNGISLAGVTYGDGIAKSGTETMESLASSKSNGSGLEFALYMPPGSAALVRLPRKSVPLYEKAAGPAGNRVL